MKHALMTLLLTMLCTSACASSMHAIKDDNSAVDAAAKATIQHKLTPIPVTYLYFDTDDQGKDYLVRVRERHDKHGGGLEVTSPTVFFMRLRKRDGHITTNAYDPAEPAFEELKPVSK